MQGERSIWKSFPDNIDLNQCSSSLDDAMEQSSAWDNPLNTVESRLSDYSRSSAEESTHSMDHANHHGRTLGGWDPGESSSGANIQGQLNVNDLKIGPSWPSINDSALIDGRSVNWKYDRPDTLLHENISTGRAGNYTQRPLGIHSSISSRSPLNATYNGGYRGNSNDSWLSRESGASSHLFRPSRSHIDDVPFHSTSSGNLESISGSSGHMVQHHDGSSSSSRSWGMSCKRKALEGNPSQPCSSGNLNMDMEIDYVGRHTRSSGHNASSGNLNMDMEIDYVGRHTRSSGHNASSSLGNVSAPSMNLQGPSRPGQLNPRTTSGIRGGNSGFHPSSVSDIAGTSERSFSFRTDRGQHEPVSFDLSATRPDVRNPAVNSALHQSRFVSSSELQEMRAPFSRASNLQNTPSQSHMTQAPGSSRHLFRRGSVDLITGAPSVNLITGAPSLNLITGAPSVNLITGAPSGSTLFSGERSAALREEGTFRSSQVSYQEYSDVASPPETIHTVPEPTAWHFSHGNANSLRNVSSSSRITPSSSSRPFPSVWMPQQNPATPDMPRYGDLPPWTLFSAVEPEPRGERGHFSFFPSASSSPEETGMSSGSSARDLNQPHPRSMLMEASSDDVNRWRGLAAATRERQRITSEIRHVLTAMRRGETLRPGDYMLFEPFSFGAAELHDRHRDMRLDVDNMSYEELLALEERIGDVKTGLSEDVIMQSMRQRKHRLFMMESSNPEPCCICQDDYVAGDDVGTLDCGHEFHTNCITQWLTVKNLCPICKTTALES